MTAFRMLLLGLVALAGASVAKAGAAELAPTRVGRVSQLDGTASLRPSSGGEWIDAGINDPLAAGMSVRTGDKGRLRLRIGPDAIALAAATRVEIGRLDGESTQLALPQGRIGIHLARLDPGSSVEIDLPQGGVWLLAPGDYDIAAGEGKNGAGARVAALDGSARIVTEHGDRTVSGGSAAELRADTIALVQTEDGARDSFVAWWRPPGGDEVEPQALRFVSPDMTGYDVLDANGRWDKAADFGEVWYPNDVAEDWAPYRVGHWRWLAPWGWTWIDDMPWGFATSHYGRWARIDDRWAWVPGPREDRPVFAPALVAFLGTAGVGLSYPDATGPAVGWFPLAPGEIYWPSYTADLDTIRRLNPVAAGEAILIEPGPNGGPPAAVVKAEYRNRRFASVVPRPVFAAGRSVAKALIELPARRLENAPLLAGSPQIPPAAARAPQAVASAAHALARILTQPAKPAPSQAAAVLRGKRPEARLASLPRADHSRADHPRTEHSRAEHPRTEHSRADRSRADRSRADARPALQRAVAVTARAPARTGSRILHMAAIPHRGRSR